MNYSDTTSALVINKLTKSQYETLKASGSLQSNQIYITPETLPSNLGDFNNDVGYVTASAVAASYATKGEVEVVTASVSSLQSSVETLGSSVDAVSSQVSAIASSVSALGSDISAVGASVSTLGSSVADLNAKLLDKRDYIDLKYPAVAQDGDNGFGISQWSYSFPIHGIGYQGTLDKYTWDGEYGVWSKYNYSPKVRTSDGQNFQFASVQDYDTGWTDSLALSQVYPQAIVSLRADAAHGQMNCELTPSFTSTTNLVLENQLSAYATASSLEVVSASVSTLSSQVGANTSSIAGLASSVSAMASNFNVSGIGCSTIVMSGTYADSTSFAFNVVVQPSA